MYRSASEHFCISEGVGWINDHNKGGRSSKALGRVHTKGVVQRRAHLRRVLKRVLKSASDKVLRRSLRRCPAVGFNGHERFLARS